MATNNSPNAWKSSQKWQIIYTKAKFESPKHPQQTCFEKAYLGEKVKKNAWVKVAQNAIIFWATYSSQKLHLGLQRVAQMAKIN